MHKIRIALYILISRFYVKLRNAFFTVGRETVGRCRNILYIIEVYRQWHSIQHSFSRERARKNTFANFCSQRFFPVSANPKMRQKTFWMNFFAFAIKNSYDFECKMENTLSWALVGEGVFYGSFHLFLSEINFHAAINVKQKMNDYSERSESEK